MCIFCELGKERIILENEQAIAILDIHPVTNGHTLIIPKRHVSSYFDLTDEEKHDCDKLLSLAKDRLLAEDKSIEGFNVGINIGKEAGQSVFHCHIHLIPRRQGDCENPCGGVRNVIPSKGRYPLI